MTEESLPKKGTVVEILLADDKELVGEWNGFVEGFLMLTGSCVVTTIMVQAKEGLVPQKILIKSKEGDNFSDTIYVNPEKILYFRELTEGSSSFSMYKQTITDLVLPRPVVVRKKGPGIV